MPAKSSAFETATITTSSWPAASMAARSKRMSGVPARTSSLGSTKRSKPLPPMSTVPMPMWISSSTPFSVERPIAWLVTVVAPTRQSHGA